MWWKKHKWKVILTIVLVVILVTAFWYGGGAPGVQGWSTKESETKVVVTSEPTDMSETSSGKTDSEIQMVARNQVSPDTVEPDVEQADPSLEDNTPVPGNGKSESVLTESPTPSENFGGAGSSEFQDKDHNQDMVIDPDTGKDKYLTDPVPEGKPLPVEPNDVTISNATYTCTISISCSTILDNMDYLDSKKTNLVPEDGWILKPTEVIFYDGESVFNVLQRTCKQYKIHMEFENTPMYNSAYIEGINNLYEFDCGELSGWMYKVNGWFPNYGCSRYALKNGDVVCWVYTCDLGADVGGRNALGS